jgi:GNAT superfamily N-acetyltransferase
MEISKLSGENISGWLDFFDNRAFSDHQEWKTCYCTYYFQPKPENYAKERPKKRDYAIWLIHNGFMQGYMAYEDTKVIGWCNANRKDRFTRLMEEKQDREEKIKSIVCFLVEKQYRNKGVATALLKQVIDDARKEGFAIIEAYPNKESKSEYRNYHGAYEMYMSHGFIENNDKDALVVRKYLK